MTNRPVRNDAGIPNPSEKSSAKRLGTVTRRYDFGSKTLDDRGTSSMNIRREVNYLIVINLYHQNIVNRFFSFRSFFLMLMQ